MPLKGSQMDAGRKTPQRARLSDITNIPTASIQTQLHKDLATLRKVVAEKEEIIKAQKVNIENLWTNYTRKTKQNENIIQQNARLFKDLMQARDRVKILQHENIQMAATHKVYKSELQAELAKALEQAENFQNSAPLTSELIPCDKQTTCTNLLSKLAESRALRTVSTNERPSDPFKNHVQDEVLEHPITCRSTPRRPASLSYKESSLKAKLRQAESAASSEVKPCINGRESQIHQLHKVSEEDPSNDCIPCNSESKVVGSFLRPVYRSASQATSDSSCALFPDMLENQCFLSSSKPEERPAAASATRFEFGDHFSFKTTEPASILSSGRPSRRSASSISSYKEAPLNTKMRRPF